MPRGTLGWALLTAPLDLTLGKEGGSAEFLVKQDANPAPNVITLSHEQGAARGPAPTGRNRNGHGSLFNGDAASAWRAGSSKSLRDPGGAAQPRGNENFGMTRTRFMTQNKTMKQVRLLLATVGVIWITGCATHKQKPPSLKPAEPMVQVIPPQGAQEPRVAEVPFRPEPIYINPVIEEVEMAPYVNDDGNLVFPGKILVIREPGHWNLAAAQNSKFTFRRTTSRPNWRPPPRATTTTSSPGKTVNQPRNWTSAACGCWDSSSRRSGGKPNRNSRLARRLPMTRIWVGWRYRATPTRRNWPPSRTGPRTMGSAAKTRGTSRQTSPRAG